MDISRFFPYSFPFPLLVGFCFDGYALKIEMVKQFSSRFPLPGVNKTQVGRRASYILCIISQWTISLFLPQLFNHILFAPHKRMFTYFVKFVNRNRKQEGIICAGRISRPLSYDRSQAPKASSRVDSTFTLASLSVSPRKLGRVTGNRTRILSLRGICPSRLD